MSVRQGLFWKPGSVFRLQGETRAARAVLPHLGVEGWRG